MSPQQNSTTNEPELISLWKRSPVILRAVLTGLLVATAGTLPWALLVHLNLDHYS